MLLSFQAQQPTAASATETQTAVASPATAKAVASDPVVTKAKKGSFYGKSSTPAAALPKIRVSLGRTPPSHAAPSPAPVAITSLHQSKAHLPRDRLDSHAHHAEDATLGDMPMTKQPAEQPLTAFDRWLAGRASGQATPADSLPSDPAAHAEAAGTAQVSPTCS